MLHIATERLNLPTVSSSCWSWKEEALDDLPWKDERGPPSIKHWNCFKGNIGETSERWGGAHMGFSKRTDTILNWTEVSPWSAQPWKEAKSTAVAGREQTLLVLTATDKPEIKGRRQSKSWQPCAKQLTWGKVMLMRLNRLCRRLEMTIRPPPGGPMAAMRNMSCWKETIRGEWSKALTRQASRLCVCPPTILGDIF